MKKKLLATALGMLCIGMCVGCAGKEEETTETKKYEEGPMVHTPVPDPYVEEKYQFGGKEIIIRDWWSAKGEKEPENDYEEAVEEMREWVG